MSAAPNEGSKREFFPQLTSVRFFAALIVVCYHYNEELKPHLPGILQNLVDHGYIGVSFFFILSGFILAANYYDRLLTKTVSKKDFWWARFSRIYPVYILSILVVAPRLFLPVDSDPLRDQAIYAHAHLPELFMVVIFGLQCFATPAGGFLNSPTWSISTELFFYILLPFLLPLLNKVKTKNLGFAILGFFALAAVGPLLYHLNFFPITAANLGLAYPKQVDFFINQFIRLNFITRIPEFLVGVMGFRLYNETLRNNHPKWLLWAGGALSLPFLGMIFFEGHDHIPNTVLYTGQLLGIPFFLTLIVGLITWESKLVNVFKTPTWVLLGEASFALYLFHIPIKHFGQFILNKALHVDKNNIVLCLALILFSILISIPIFNKIETPVRKKLAAWWKNRKAPVTA